MEYAYKSRLLIALCSERTWGPASPYMLISIAEQSGLDAVIKLIREPEFKQGHIPGIRVYKLLGFLEIESNREEVRQAAAEAGIDLVVWN